MKCLPADAILQPGEVLVVVPPTATPTITVTPAPNMVISPLPTLTVPPPPAATVVLSTSTFVPVGVEVAQVTPPPLTELTQETTRLTKDAAVWPIVLLVIFALMLIMTAGAIVMWMLLKRRFWLPS
jgi:hypothetical protein